MFDTIYYDNQFRKIDSKIRKAIKEFDKQISSYMDALDELTIQAHEEVIESPEANREGNVIIEELEQATDDLRDLRNDVLNAW
jgi:DNA mismatch repair ATPase MutS